jgi:crotonobetainyl-CoA:carnitine CoA-transferase CaiB-like acyl-CoA transferase
MLLASLGAEVVKVEEPERGDYMRWFPPLVDDYGAMFHAINGGKKSIKLNLKTETGREVFLALAAKADAVIEGNRPGVADKLGISYKDVSKVNPGIVYCSISGFGQDGPYTDKVGHDINYMGYAGALGADEQGETPCIPGVQAADLAGAMMSVISVLGALLARERTGNGQYIDVSMHHVVVSWLALEISKCLGDAPAPSAATNLFTGAYPCYNVYETADDGHLSIGALEIKFWHTLCQAVGREDLIDEQFASGQRAAEVKASLNDLFKTKTRDEWLDLLGDKECCVGPVYELPEVLTDPHVIARNLIGKEPTSGVNRVMFPAVFSRAKTAHLEPAPKFGEHTDAILADIGYNEEQIASLRTEGII